MTTSIDIGLYDPQKRLQRDLLEIYHVIQYEHIDSIRNANDLLIAIECERKLPALKLSAPDIPLFYLSETFPVIRTFEEWLPLSTPQSLLQFKIDQFITERQADCTDDESHHYWKRIRQLQARVTCIEAVAITALSTCSCGVIACDDSQEKVIWNNAQAERMLQHENLVGRSAESLQLGNLRLAPHETSRLNIKKYTLPATKNTLSHICFLSDPKKEAAKKEIEGFKGYLKLRAKEHVRNLSEDRAKIELANRRKTEFLAQMSHELRTPMHVILSLSELGARKVGVATNARLQRYFDTIHRSGKQLLVLLDNLLDLSRMETGGMEYQLAPASLGAITQQIITQVQVLLQERSMTLHFQPPMFNDKTNLDKNKISQVILNLLSNAIKFSHPNSSISIVLARSETHLECRVIDEGVGVPTDEQATIFDKFTQSRITKTQNMGTGLGLAICREIVESHGGRIGLDAQPTTGACFYFTLPLT